MLSAKPLGPQSERKIVADRGIGIAKACGKSIEIGIAGLWEKGGGVAGEISIGGPRDRAVSPRFRGKRRRSP